MPEVKLVLSDMDDTLAPHMKNKVSDTVRQAVIDTEDSGVRVAVVTGRAYTHAKSALELLGVEGPCVFDGGGTIVDAVSGDVLHKQWIEVAKTQQIVAILRKYCTEAYFDHTSGMRILAEVDIETIQDEAPSIFATADTYSQLEKAAEALYALDGIRFFTGTGTHPQTEAAWPSLHITRVDADKYHGVEALRSMIGISKDHTLAIGDGTNDMPLFQNAHVKVAMGNAVDELKQAADYIVGTLVQDGFAEAMYKYVLRHEP